MVITMIPRADNEKKKLITRTMYLDILNSAFRRKAQWPLDKHDSAFRSWYVETMGGANG